MKLYLVLGLLFLGANGQGKINLDDIERDNLRSEGIAKTGNARPDAGKFLKPEIGQQQYQIPSQYNRPTASPVTYVTPSSSQNAAPGNYVPFNSYAVKEQVYQQQNNILPEQVLPPQYYNEYQQQLPLPSKGIVPNVYESQQLVYQPEVAVGNQLQAAQQKTVTAKYAKNANKETIYVNIPMMHLLTYYPNLDISTGKSSSLLLPQTTAATQQISVPLYTSTFSQKPIVSLKPNYQVRNALKGTAYTTPVTSKKYTNAPLANVPTYVPADQSYAQGRQLLYTQAYVAPSQPQYVSQLVYAQPTTVYMHATPIYSDIFARPTSYVQDNSLQGTVKYSSSAEQLDTTTPAANELPNQVFGQQATQSVSQNYVKDSEELSSDLVPPQLPPQDFKSEATPQVSEPQQEDESVPVQNHVGLSEPRSLLDTYVPSKVIAAQDSARYQERPIKLEGGFLPSKENFLHKKRKTN